MELEIENILSEITKIPHKLGPENTVFKVLEEKFENDYEKLVENLPKKTLIESIGVLATIKLFQSVKEKNEQKTLALKEFRNYLNKSDKLEINQKRSFALKGFYYFYQGDFRQSIKYFDNAKDIDNYYLPQILGRGLVEYNRKDYKAALNNFKQVFQYYRHIVPQAAYIIGLCYFNLNRFELAEKCFLYMIKYNLGCFCANHVALALVKYKFNDTDGYFQHLVKAFENNTNVNELNVCLNLSEHYFFKRDFDKVIKLAKRGLKETEALLGDYKNFDRSGRNDYHELKSRFSYILGFIEHSYKTNEGIAEAYKYYQAALQSNPFNYAAQFGLAQIYYSQRNYVNANECLETIISKLPEHLCKDCYILIPHVYIRLNKEQKAYEAFEKVMKYFPNDLGVLIDYVSYLELSHTKTALEIYEKILKCCDKEKVQPEILNNMAVNFMQNEQFDKALSIFDKAKTEIMDYDTDQSKSRALKLLIDYNTARLFQKQNFNTKALNLYKDIIDRNPLFYECYLHLAKIYLTKDDIASFNENLNTAMYICYKTLSVSRIEFPFYIQVANMIKSQKYEEALEYISKIKRQDTFLLLYRASVFYNLVVYNRSNITEAKRYIKHSAELCSLILRNKEETNNIYAANMVASLLSERGRTNDSLAIFRSFQDIIETNSPLLYNMAIAEYLAGNFEKAMIILESPKSHYKLKYDILYGILNILLEKYGQAEKTLKYRYIRNPGLMNLYNYVACLHKRVKDLFVKKEVRIDDVELLKASLKYCENVFSFIDNAISHKVANILDSTIDKAEIERRKLFDIKKNCEKQLFYLRQNKESYQKMIDRELEKRKQVKISQEQRKKLMEMEKSKLNQKEEETKKAELSKEELMELKAKEAMKMAESLLNDLKVQKNEVKQPSKKTKKEKIINEDENEEMPIAKEKKIKKTSKKESKKGQKAKDKESDMDSFIDANIDESEKSVKEKEYKKYNFSEESENEAIYDPLQNYNDEENINLETQKEPRKLRRKTQPIAKKDNNENNVKPKGPNSINESAEISGSSMKEEVNEEEKINDVNEDIYIVKHRPNKKLLMDEDDE